MRNVETPHAEFIRTARMRTSMAGPELGRVVADASWPLLSDQTRTERRLALRNNRRLAAGLILSIAAAALILDLFFGVDAGIVTLLALPLPCIGLFERFRRTTVANDAWLVEQPEEGEFLVEMLVEVNGVVMGSDRGVAWFEPTAVCFTGQRSWFRIGVEHIYEQSADEGSTAHLNEMNVGRTTMRLRYDAARVRVKLIDDGTPGGTGSTRLASQMAELSLPRHTRRHAGLPTQTTLPPLTIDPEYRHDIFHNTELNAGSYYVLLMLPSAAMAHSVLETAFVLLVIVAAGLSTPLNRLIRPAILRSRAFERAHFGTFDPKC